MFRTPQDQQDRQGPPRRSGRIQGWVNSIMGGTFTPDRLRGRLSNEGTEPAAGVVDAGGDAPDERAGGEGETADEVLRGVEALTLVQFPTLPKCNNGEREWLRAAADRVDLLLHSIHDFHSVENKDPGRAAQLIEEARVVRADLWKVWNRYETGFRERRRHEARAQAGEVWDQIEDRLQKATEYLQNVSIAIGGGATTGALPKVVVRAPGENSPGAHAGMGAGAQGSGTTKGNGTPTRSNSDKAVAVVAPGPTHSRTGAPATTTGRTPLARTEGTRERGAEALGGGMAEDEHVVVAGGGTRMMRANGFCMVGGGLTQQKEPGPPRRSLHPRRRRRPGNDLLQWRGRTPHALRSVNYPGE